MDLTTVADELYGLPPDKFTAARNERAKAARAAGDRDLATAIGKLRRPTVSAWLANLLTREHHEQVAELLELGTAMRGAQQRLAGDELRELSRQRHAVVSALAREAGALAAAEGEPLSDQVTRELEGTLEAALADQDAGAALGSGRLTSALTYSGLGGVDLGPAIARPAAPAARPAAQPAPAPPTRGRRTAEPASDEARQRVRIQAAETDVAEAQEAADAAAATAAAQARRMADASRERDDVRARIAELESGLRALQTREAAATKELRDAQRAADAAAAVAERAAHRLERARSRLADERRH